MKKCTHPGCRSTTETVDQMVDHMIRTHRVVRGPVFQRRAIARLLDGSPDPLPAVELAGRLGLSEGRARDLANDLVSTGYYRMHQGKPRRFSSVPDSELPPLDQHLLTGTDPGTTIIP